MKMTYLLALAVLVITGCKKEEETPSPSTPTPTTPAPTYPVTGPASFSATSGTTTTVYQDGQGGFETSGWAVVGSGVAGFASSLLDPDVFGSGSTVSLVGQSYAGADLTDDEFYAYFAVGSKPFAALAPGSTGVSITYEKGSANMATRQATQSGSTFTITHAEPVDDGSGISKVKVRATFSCNFVNSSTFQQEAVSGIFVGVFKKS